MLFYLSNFVFPTVSLGWGRTVVLSDQLVLLTDRHARGSLSLGSYDGTKATLNPSSSKDL